MASSWELYMLVLVTVYCISYTEGTNCSVNIPPGALEDILINLDAQTTGIELMAENQEDMKNDLADLKQNLEDMKDERESTKRETLRRLDMVDRTMVVMERQLTAMEKALNKTPKAETPEDCQEGLMLHGWTSSGVYRIAPTPDVRMDVYCEQELDGGGWTVIQARKDGSVDFNRGWMDYRNGFGNLTSDYWLGNDNIFILTKDNDKKLKVELTFYSTTTYADYSMFRIDSERYKYLLHVGGFSGASPPGDSLGYHSGNNFSTKDSDNDQWPMGNCAERYYSPWWMKNCRRSGLNGLFSTSSSNGIYWYTWKKYTPLTGARMMVKKKLV